MSGLNKTKSLFSSLSAAFLAFSLQSASADEMHAEQNIQRHESRLSASLPDLTEHPLAGATILVEVCATDHFGQRGCDSGEVTLPLPMLNNPLGYEVQALRRELALMVENTRRGADGLPYQHSLQEGAAQTSLRFEEFFDEHSLSFHRPHTLFRIMDLHYELIAAADEYNINDYERIIRELREAIVALEDDLLSDAEIELRDAREAHRDAMERGADSEELKALNDALMEAMDNYLQEQLDLAQENGLSPEDIENMEMMRELMEELAKLLEEMGITPEEYAQMLQDMMGGSPPPPSGDMSPPSASNQPPNMEQMLQALREKIEMMIKMHQFITELNAIIDDQQALRDESLEQALRNQQQRLSEEDAQRIQSMRDRQEDIQRRLAEITDKMRAEGIPTDALEYALGEMNSATNFLGQNRTGEAVIHQDNALDALRQGSDDMNALMMMMPGGGGGDMPGGGDMESPSQGMGNDTRIIVDESGRLREGSNTNENIGIDPGAGGSESAEIRDRILNRDRTRESGAGGGFRDRLLQGIEP